MDSPKTLGQTLEISLDFIKEKETKNTIRYQETVDGDDIVIGPLYIQKSFLPENYPEKVKVKLTINI
jgi:hypothetical protein|tara:strand:+ start:107 stop:307 length:201 start_codon:yes stop_codon:yes gene_type:complete